MVVLGVILKSNIARLVALSGTRNQHLAVRSKVNKLEIPKNPTRDDVESFVQAFKSFCAVNVIDCIVVNRRASAGQGAGSASTFLTEGVLLAASPCTVEFVHPATIKATDRKQGGLKTCRPETVDLGLAYDLAFERLPA
ncbi:DUF3010 family protein [Rhodoferax sp. OV413]|uniref:DUF3010 family protein n=1 Tax=Rhodoferax sp. OV413 TaxID=1855285 RepID=UPI000B85BECC|nr:DUF3010 family protein [Rhodoferax sp. OV413]